MAPQDSTSSARRVTFHVTGSHSHYTTEQVAAARTYSGYSAPARIDSTIGPGIANAWNTMYTAANVVSTKAGWPSRYASAHCHASRVAPNKSPSPPTNDGNGFSTIVPMEMPSHARLQWQRARNRMNSSRNGDRKQEATRAR